MSRAVLITGCSTGIGRAAAQRLAAREGWTVYATARRPSDIDDLRAAGCRTLALDVRDEASMAAAVGVVERAHGQVHALVNNAGYSQSGAIETIPIERLRAQFETNVFGLVRLTQLVLPAMRRARAGRIVNISSMGGRLVFAGGGAYHATKYAVEAISDALRFELHAFGIHVVVVQPGLIRTQFADTVQAHLEGADDPVYGEFHTRVATATANAYGRGVTSKLAGSPDDVARVIETALTVPRPRTRYAVTLGARVFMTQRRWLGDRAWDRFLRAIYPSPGAAKD